MAEVFPSWLDPAVGPSYSNNNANEQVPRDWATDQQSQAPATSTSRYGVRNDADVQEFLTTEWVNYNGMNNMLLYASGVYGQVGKGAPYTGSNVMSTTSVDTITGVANGTISSSEFQANGVLASTTSISPTVGELFVVSVMGAQGSSVLANRPFQFTSTVGNQKRSSWASYIGVGAMWIGDTPKKRAIWASGAINNGNTFSGRAGFPFPAGAPRAIGGGSYSEQGNATPPLDPWAQDFARWETNEANSANYANNDEGLIVRDDAGRGDYGQDPGWA